MFLTLAAPRIRLILSLWLLPLLCSASACSKPKTSEAVPFTAQFIANEGVLIAHGDKQVIIDGFFREHYPQYPPLLVEHREKLETAQAPFDEIDLILATHRHRDHFNPEAALRYLRHHPSTHLIANPQIIQEIEALDYDKKALQDQIHPLDVKNGEKQRIELAGMAVEVMGLSHGAGRFKDIRNTGFLIELDGKRFLHVGDAQVSAPNFSVFNLPERQIDLAILPYWYLVEGQRLQFVKESIAPQHIIAAHIPPKKVPMVRQNLSQNLPQAFIFAEQLQIYTLPTP